MAKIFVEKDWYIPVDDDGYVTGPCFEGMLGCVLQLKGEPTGRAALKIPRLLADTVEENAYICKLMEDEEEAAFQVRNEGGKTHFLLDAQFLGRNPLRLRRSTEHSAREEAQEQSGHVIFVYFERDRKPRFFAVDLTDTDFSVFPASCKDYFKASISSEDWKSFINLTKSESQPSFSLTLFRCHDLGGGDDIGRLTDALGTERIASIWYAAVPSVVFDWAEGNLQEAITKQEIKDWSLEDHFTLFEVVLDAVSFLHKQGMIHGDIRPANVMRIGPQEPKNYRLGDYGSYGKEWHAIADGLQPGGLTQAGPAIGRLRDTPFYAPERRAGRQFESANISIINKVDLGDSKGGFNYLVLVGWRSDLLSGDGTIRHETQKIIAGLIKQEIQRINLEAKKAGDKKSIDVKASGPNLNAEELQKGDRLRLKNYLFEVIQSVQTDSALKCYLCTSRYAEIIHDHLVVYKKVGEIENPTVIDLSNYVEFRQWSAATDLYGVGALCLYSLFSCGLQKQETSTAATLDGTTPQSEENLATQNPHITNGENPVQPSPDPLAFGGYSLDSLFVDMMDILQSDPYFKFFWKELEKFRKQIETLYEERPQPSSNQAAWTRVLTEGSPSGQTLYDMALYTTNNILQSTPKAGIILKQFDMNLARFLLFMHFVLACLHRQSHMPSQEAGSSTPFAADRTEPPMEGGAASRALKRLTKLKAFLVQPFFDEFKCREKTQILDFNPRSDFQMRIELEKLKREIRNLSKKGFWDRSLRSDLRKLVGKIDLEDQLVKTQGKSVVVT